MSSSGRLILGLGPNGAGPPDLTGNGNHIYWLETPRILGALDVAPPAHWQRVTAAEAIDLARKCRTYFYTPGMRLEPSYWQPIRAAVDWAAQKTLYARDHRRVWLPGSCRMLLQRDLEDALKRLGYGVNTALANRPEELPETWQGLLPRWALSVNFRGLDPEGKIFAFCVAAQVPLAIWLVDNPWNLLTAIPYPWWREAQLFVTDATFIPSLKRNGARHVYFLPLAAGRHFFKVNGTGNGQPIFVGRSAFPHRDRYFAHCHIEPALLAKATAWLDDGGLPDFWWWEAQCKRSLWPGNGSRLPAYGAELCSQQRRALWLRATLPYGLRIVGDAQWQTLLSGAPIEPPVDYYGTLGDLYAEALCCLNVTSLLLPGSLNQRHFDVWAAGGFLLTDWTPGLKLFPGELAQFAVLNSQNEIGAKIRWLRDHRDERRKLSGQWRQLIWEKHLYEHRIREIENILQ